MKKMMTPKRGRGRPKGAANGKRFTEQWQPKRWKPLYDSILALAVAGFQNKAIAQELKLSAQAVNMILNSDQGRAKLAVLQARKQQVIAESIDGRIAKLQDTALARVEAVINNAELLENAPFKIFDRSMQVLRGTGVFKQETKEDDTPRTQNNLNLLIADPGLAKQIADGAAKALEATQRHANSFARITTGGSVKGSNGPRVP